jgi:3-methyladenine DNA glycosylase AlkD
MESISQDLRKAANKEKVAIYQNFFKTGKGQYGEGDIFLGVNVPDQRLIAKKHKDISLSELKELLSSKIHEERLTALIILTYKYQDNKKAIFDFYMKNSKYINNWDLVDVTAPKIVGDYLLDKDKELLYKLVKSQNIWERRIAIVSTQEFIRKGKFEDTLKISTILLQDKHDLIHKAVGWMLREVGKKDTEVLIKFLDQHSKTMPRTMLRYAIEKFEEEKRLFYMKK